MPVVTRKVSSMDGLVEAVGGLSMDLFVREERPVNDDSSNDSHDTNDSDSDNPSSRDSDGDNDNDNGDDNGNDTDGDDGHGADDGPRTFTETLSNVSSGTGTPTVTTITETTHRSHSSTSAPLGVTSSSSSFTSTSTSKSGSAALNLSTPKRLSGGSIGGIVFASVLGAIILGGLFLYFCRRRKRSRQNSSLDLIGNSGSTPAMAQIARRNSRPNLFAPDTRPNSPDREHLHANLAPRRNRNGGDDHSEGDESTNTQASHNMAGVGAGVVNLSEAMGLPRTAADVGGNTSISPRNSRYGYYGSTNSRVPILSPHPLPLQSSMMSTDDTKFPLSLVPGESGRSTPIPLKRFSLTMFNDSDHEGSGRSSFVETDAGPVTSVVMEEPNETEAQAIERGRSNPPPY